MFTDPAEVAAAEAAELLREKSELTMKIRKLMKKSKKAKAKTLLK